MDLDTQAQFGRTRVPFVGKLPGMQVDPREVGRRIVEARLDKGGLETYAALAKALQRRTGKKGKPSPEVVRLWETGNHAPPYEMVELLSLELDRPGEWILFGITPDIQQERYVMERVSSEELALLSYLRTTAKDHRGDTIEHAALVAKRHPAPSAEIKRFPPPRKT